MPHATNPLALRSVGVQAAPPGGSVAFRRVLVGLDLTDGDEALIHSLLTLRAWGVEQLVLAHVARLSPAPLIHRSDATKGVGEKLARAHVRLAPRFRVELSMLSGDPAARLSEEAEARGADAIVLGSRKRSSIEEAFVGSTVAEVLHRTRLPVLVVPHAVEEDRHLLPAGPTDQSRILHPTDFSEPADRALRVVGDLAQALGLPVTLLHVVEGEDPRLEREGRRRLSRLAASLEEAGVRQVEVSVTKGEPWGRILEHAGEGGGTLIVMGTRGRRVLPGIILGSQSRGVVGHSDCPVLLVPREHRQPR